MTAAKILIDSEGRIQTDEATLAKLRNREFVLQEEGQRLKLETHPRRLHEIQDVEERARAFEEFVQSVAIADAPSWPENYNLRDDIYD